MDVCACVWGSVVGSHPFMSTPYEHFTVKLANGLSRSVLLSVCECYSRHVTLCTLLVSLFYRSAVSIYCTSHHEAFGFYLTLGWWILVIIDTVDTSHWNNVFFRKFSNVVMFQFIYFKNLQCSFGSLNIPKHYILKHFFKREPSIGYTFHFEKSTY